MGLEQDCSGLGRDQYSQWTNEYSLVLANIQILYSTAVEPIDP